MKRILFLFGVIGWLGGCATLPTSQRGSAQKVDSKPEPIRVINDDKKQIRTSCIESESELKKLSRERWLDVGNACVAEKNWSGVEFVGQTWSGVDSTSPWGPYYLSLAAEAHNELSRALWMIELANKRNNKTGLLVYQKGRILWKMEEYNRALETIFESLKLDSHLTEGHLFLGEVYFRDAEYEKASGYFNSVLMLDSRNFQALVGLSECRLLKNDNRGAIELLDQAIGENSRSYDLYMRKAFILETKEKDLHGALQVYQTVRDILPSQKRDLKAEVEGKIKLLESQLAKLEAKPKTINRGTASQKQ